MTKPFQSIRQLFGRMGSLLGGYPAGEARTAHEYSTLGIGSPEPHLATNGNGQSDGFAGEHPQPEIEAQMADTQRLPQVAPESLSGRNGGGSDHRVAPDEGADEFGDVLLDLGDVRGAKAFVAADPVLDIFGETAPHGDFFEALPEAPARAKDAMSVRDAFAEDSSEAAAPVPAFEESEEWSNAAEAVAVEVAPPESKAEESAPASSASVSDLSPEAIDAIAQRVVAQLSDKVVREIAWDILPELAESLIKQKLEAK